MPFRKNLPDGHFFIYSSERGEEGSSSGVCLEPPTGFSDSRGLMVTGRDRNAIIEKLANELATEIAG